MKKRIAIIAIVLAVVIGVAALVIVSRPKKVKVHEYKVCEVDFTYADQNVPIYWNKEMQQWVKVWDDSPIPERLLCKVPPVYPAGIGSLYIIEGYTPWDYWYGDGIPQLPDYPNYYIVHEY